MPEEHHASLANKRDERRTLSEQEPRTAAVVPHLVIAPDATSTPENPAYRWHLTQTNGKVLVQDPNSYDSPEKAEAAVRNLIKWVAQAFRDNGIERRTSVLPRTAPEITIADVVPDEEEPPFEPEYDPNIGPHDPDAEPEIDYRDPTVPNDVEPAVYIETDAEGNQPGPALTDSE